MRQMSGNYLLQNNMNFKVISVVLVIFSLVAICISYEQDDAGSKVVLECVNYQLCTCDMISDYEDCWLMLMEETRVYAVDLMNEACDFKLEHTDPYPDMVVKGCIVPKDAQMKCYETIMPIVFEYLEKHDSSTDPQSRNISTASAKGRTCLMPNVSKCIQFPGMCF